MTFAAHMHLLLRQEFTTMKVKDPWGTQLNALEKLAGRLYYRFDRTVFDEDFDGDFAEFAEAVIEEANK